MSAESPVWFKSSYSSNDGGECVELSYAWRKSSYSSGEGGQCVEVAEHPTAIHIRDSKLPLTHLTVHPSTWASFLTVAHVQAR
ncbi:DUF397 domain-containing protein [Streptomyces sp. SUK 48]|uniref:DUF397 domain-containing protein n=1 Tax=unclassified Streptomyces TaxID=2593676 RepID=UPI00129B4C4D|nr:DUF397 domain-containing protein [Streptomyces sp. SUK 48]